MASESVRFSHDAGARWRRRWSRRACAALLCLAVAEGGAEVGAEGGAAMEPVPDWTPIGAIFQARCVMCHSEAAAERDLRLDSYAGAIAGGDNGPVLVPGDPAASELVRRLNGASRPRMPFLSYPLSAEEIDLIERWIEAGLPESVPATTGAGSN